MDAGKLLKSLVLHVKQLERYRKQENWSLMFLQE